MEVMGRGRPFILQRLDFIFRGGVVDEIVEPSHLHHVVFQKAANIATLGGHIADSHHMPVNHLHIGSGDGLKQADLTMFTASILR